jgi:hypothetical protein
MFEDIGTVRECACAVRDTTRYSEQKHFVPIDTDLFPAGLCVSSHVQLEELLRIETFCAPTAGEHKSGLLWVTAHMLLKETFSKIKK